MEFSPPPRRQRAEVLSFSPGVAQQPRSRHAAAAAAEPDFDSVFDDSVDSVDMSFDAEAAGDYDSVFATAAPSLPAAAPPPLPPLPLMPTAATATSQPTRGGSGGAGGSSDGSGDLEAGIEEEDGAVAAAADADADQDPAELADINTSLADIGLPRLPLSSLGAGGSCGAAASALRQLLQQRHGAVIAAHERYEGEQAARAQAARERAAAAALRGRLATAEGEAGQHKNALLKGAADHKRATTKLRSELKETRAKLAQLSNLDQRYVGRMNRAENEYEKLKDRYNKLLGGGGGGGGSGSGSGVSAASSRRQSSVGLRGGSGRAAAAGARPAAQAAARGMKLSAAAKPAKAKAAVGGPTDGAAAAVEGGGGEAGAALRAYEGRQQELLADNLELRAALQALSADLHGVRGEHARWVKHVKRTLRNGGGRGGAGAGAGPGPQQQQQQQQQQPWQQLASAAEGVLTPPALPRAPEGHFQMPVRWVRLHVEGPLRDAVEEMYEQMAALGPGGGSRGSRVSRGGGDRRAPRRRRRGDVAAAAAAATTAAAQRDGGSGEEDACGSGSELGCCSSNSSDGTESGRSAEEEEGGGEGGGGEELERLRVLVVQQERVIRLSLERGLASHQGGVGGAGEDPLSMSQVMDAEEAAEREEARRLSLAQRMPPTPLLPRGGGGLAGTPVFDAMSPCATDRGASPQVPLTELKANVMSLFDRDD
jgi:hypothetical protein